MARIRIRFNRQERRALKMVGYSRKDLTNLRRRILAGPLDTDTIDVLASTLKEIVGHSVHQARTQKETDA